jgi:hypothetical protein
VNAAQALFARHKDFPTLFFSDERGLSLRPEAMQAKMAG